MEADMGDELRPHETRQRGDYDRIGETDWFACGVPETKDPQMQPILGVPEWRTIIMFTYFAVTALALMATIVLIAKWANAGGNQ